MTLRRYPILSLVTVVFVILMAGLPVYAAQDQPDIKSDIGRVVLDNGLVVLIAERHTLPTVHVSMAIQAGTILDTPEKAGLSNLTASLLDEGTQTRTSQQIADAIDFIGGSVGASGGMDYASASLTVLKKDLNTGMDLLSDILLHPVFPQEELDRVRKEILGGIQAQKTDPDAMVSKTFSEMLYGGHPYGLPVEGKEETLPKVTRDDIVKFYQDNYRPNRTILVIVGDVTRTEALDLIRKYFGTWEKKAVTPVSLPPAVKPASKQVKQIQRDITQANIILGHRGISRDNPDFYNVYVMNYILGGGGFSSRLTKEVREERGLAYGVYSMFDVRKFPGAFRISLQTKNESANEALSVIRKEVERIQKEEVSDEELSDAKDYLTGSFPLRLDTNSKMAGFLTFVEFYNLGLDYIQEYPKKIRAVTKKDVLKAAKKYLDPEHYTLAVVANLDKAKIVAP